MAYLLRFRPRSVSVWRLSNWGIIRSPGVLHLSSSSRSMTNTASSTHEERTAAAQREAHLHQVQITKIEQANESVRLLRLVIPPSKQVKARLSRNTYGFI